MRFGPYEVVNEIARGGMGIVYRARDPGGGQVAIKTLLGVSDARTKRFRREARALANLTHPNIVRVLAAGDHEGRPWMAMQLIEGQTLQERLDRRGSLHPEEAAELVATLADAVEHCHRHEILHRDLKPDNVLLDGDRPILTDFGLVKDVGPQGESSVVTIRGCLLGTPGFWAPEQVIGDSEAVGPGADIYGLGAVLYALLTGRTPIVADTILAHVLAVQEGTIEPTGTPLDAIVLRCLQRDPADRYLSAATLAAELRGELDPNALDRYRSCVMALAGTGLALMLVGLAFVLWSNLAKPTPPPPGDPRALYEAGLKKGRLDTPGAIADFDRAIELDPTFADALWQRAAAKASLGDHAGAIVDFVKASELKPEATQIYVGLAGSRRALRDFDGLIADCDRWIDTHGPSDHALRERGRAKADKGEFPGAIEDYTAALRLNPKSPQTYLRRGLALRDLGRHARAGADLRQALQLDPGLRRTLDFDVEAYSNPDRAAPKRPAQLKISAAEHYRRGRHLAGRRDYTAAIHAFTRAIEADPKHDLAYASRGHAKVTQAQYADAVRDFSRAIKLRPRPDTYNNRGFARYMAGDRAGAEQDYSEAIALRPGFFQALKNRGNVRYMLGLYKGSLADNEKALKLQPRDTEILSTLGLLYHRRGEVKRAAGAWAKLLKFARPDELSPDKRKQLREFVKRNR